MLMGTSYWSDSTQYTCQIIDGNALNIYRIWTKSYLTLKVVWNNTKNYNMLHKISRFLKIHFSDNNKNPTGKLSLTPSSMSSSCQMDVWALMCGVVWHPSSSPSCYWHAWPDLDLGRVIHMWTNIGGPLLATAPCESHLQKELPLSVLLRGLWASTYP